MTEEREPTPKQWKRRALHAEQQMERMQLLRAHESANEIRTSREICALRVALKEAHEAIQWALEQQT